MQRPEDSLGYSVGLIHFFFFFLSLLLAWNLTSGPAWEPVTRMILLSLPPQHGDCRCTPSHLAFSLNVGALDCAQVLLSYSPQPPFCPSKLST